jgi:hypothetical protein
VYSTFRWTATGSPRCGISCAKDSSIASRPTLNALSYSTAGYREVGRGQLAGTEVVYFEKTLA